ncbi:MAG: hypothetical protein Tsb0019_16230 [Roseibium sp.]
MDKEVASQIAFLQHLYPELHDFLQRSEIAALVEEQVRRRHEAVEKLLRQQSDGKIAKDDFGQLLERSIGIDGRKLNREIRKARKRLERQPAVAVEILNGENVCPQGTRFFLAVRAVQERDRISFESYPTGFGFFGSFAEFFQDPEAWRKDLKPRVELRKNPYLSLGSVLRFSEYEPEALPQRVGSGETGLQAQLNLHPVVHEALETKAGELHDFDETLSVLKRSLQHLIIVSTECAPFSAPEKRQIEPDGPIPDRFSKDIALSKIAFEHFSIVDPAGGDEAGDTIRWQYNTYRKIGRWSAVERTPGQESGLASAGANSKPWRSSTDGLKPTERNVSPAARVLARIGLGTIAASLLIHLVLQWA